MIDQNRIKELLDEKLDGTEVFVCEILVSNSNVITVFIDGDKGVNVDHCSSISRFLESKLDRDSEDYELRVSSFGADRPLISRRQYPKHVGRTLQVIRKDESEIKGTFESFDDQHIILKPILPKSKKQVVTELLSIPFEDIKEATVVISFQ